MLWFYSYGSYYIIEEELCSVWWGDLQFHPSFPDPVQWSTDQVLHWVVWVMKEFSMTDIDLNALSIPGRELCNLSQEDFFQRVPRGEILWSHLELLRKCMAHFSATDFTYSLLLGVFWGFFWLFFLNCETNYEQSFFLYLMLEVKMRVSIQDKRRY